MAYPQEFCDRLEDGPDGAGIERECLVAAFRLFRQRLKLNLKFDMKKSITMLLSGCLGTE